jgi:hypothetical protein
MYIGYFAHLLFYWSDFRAPGRTRICSLLIRSYQPCR